MTAAFLTPITTLADQDGVIEGPWRLPIEQHTHCLRIAGADSRRKIKLSIVIH